MPGRFRFVRSEVGASTATDPAHILQDAHEHFKAGRNSHAEALCRELLTEHPGNVDAAHLLGAILLKSGRAMFAVLLLERAAAQAADPEIRVTLGTALREAGDPAGSERVLRSALSDSPDNGDARLQLGVTLLDRGEAAQAVDELRRATASTPGSAYAPFWLANALLDIGEDEAALSAYEKAVDIDGSARSLHLHRAGYLKSVGLREGALRLYRWGLALNPGDPELAHMEAALTGDAPPRCSDSYVVKHFDNFAQTFDSTLVDKLEYRTPELLADAVKSALPKGREGSLAVMDAGCGTGLCGPLLRPLAARLVGVDLSPGMLERARERGMYDELRVGEITSALRDEPEAYDLIVAADVLVYFGDLFELMAAIADGLTSGGWAAVSIERHDGDVPLLMANGRYAHPPDHLRAAASAAGLQAISELDCHIRMESGQPVDGTVAVFQREPPG